MRAMRRTPMPQPRPMTAARIAPVFARSGPDRVLAGLLPGSALGREAGVAVHGGEHLRQGHDVAARQEGPERLGVRLVVLDRGRRDGEAVAGGAADEGVGDARDAPVGRDVLSVQRVVQSGEHAGRVGEFGQSCPLDQRIALAAPSLLADQVGL